MFAPANTAHFTLQIPAVRNDFKVLAFEGVEAISTLYAIQVELVSEYPDFDLESLLSQPAFLQFGLNGLDETQLSQFMGPLTDMAWRNELGWRHLANPRPDPQGVIQQPGWLHLSVERLAQMEAHRLKLLAGRLALDYEPVLAMPEPVDFVYRQLLAARQAGYLQLCEQERWLRLALRQGDGFWSSAPITELLARDDLGLGDKLIELERL